MTSLSLKLTPTIYEIFKGLDFLKFSTEIQELGVTEVRALIPDGRNVIVSWRSFY